MGFCQQQLHTLVTSTMNAPDIDLYSSSSICHDLMRHENDVMPARVILYGLTLGSRSDHMQKPKGS